MSSGDANNTPAGSLAAVGAAAVAAAAADAGPASDDAGADIISATLADICAVQQRFTELAAGHDVLAGQGADEECERELEQEEEEEKEQETELPAEAAAAETDWTWAAALTATSASQLLGCRTMQLPEAVALVQPSESADVRSISWSPKVLVSRNFLCSVERRGSGFGALSDGLAGYMRPVAGLLFFPGSGELLLLSEREADALQKLAWDTARTRPSAAPAQAPAPSRARNVLLSLSSLRLAFTEGSSGPEQPLFLATQLPPASPDAAAPRQLSTLLQQRLPLEALVSVQLFAGSVMVGSARQRQHLHNLMRGKKEAAADLVGWRGKLHMLPRSDLDRACADDVFG
jgi:hypothetical protein